MVCIHVVVVVVVGRDARWLTCREYENIMFISDKNKTKIIIIIKTSNVVTVVAVALKPWRIYRQQTSYVLCTFNICMSFRDIFSSFWFGFGARVVYNNTRISMCTSGGQTTPRGGELMDKIVIELKTYISRQTAIAGVGTIWKVEIKKKKRLFVKK